MWRRVLRLSWTERITNKWVRERISNYNVEDIANQLKTERWQIDQLEMQTWKYYDSINRG